ncbi:MAG: LapA family protein [Hyphomicrobiales bacterium]|nr:LapA family protein [Hyphomicrobiales bacterium]
MIKKIVYIVVLGPIALIVIAFCVANRQLVDFSYDPLGGADPTMTLRLPLFVLILAGILIGIVAGGFAAWLRQGKWRRSARVNAHEAARWQREAQELRQRLEESARRALPGASAEPPLS